MKSYKIFKAQEGILSEIAIYHYGVAEEDDDEDEKTLVSTF